MSLSVFNDFMTATDQTVLTGPNELVNEAVRNSYFFSEVMRGRPNTEVVQGGTKIVDQLVFEDHGTYQHVSPTDTFNWQNPQTLVEWEIPWRFGMNYMVWFDHEIELQVPDGLSANARARVYKRIKNSKETGAVTSTINGLEDELWAAPSNASMEASTGRAPYSIPFMVNEETNGLTTGVTTKQSIAPATYAKWVPQQEGYDYSTINLGVPADQTSDSVNLPLIVAFDAMYNSHRFDTLPGNPDKSEPRSNATMIACSSVGERFYKQCLRIGNDTWVSANRQDPHYGNTMYANIPSSTCPPWTLRPTSMTAAPTTPKPVPPMTAPATSGSTGSIGSRFSTVAGTCTSTR